MAIDNGMKIPKNHFKDALLKQKVQIGLWLSMCNSYTTDIVADIGYDWLLLDTEHAPNEIQSILQQLQVIEAYSSSPIVRPSWNDHVQLKRYLDIGAQTFLIPYVQTVEEAIQAVAATRYPPRGFRGVGGTSRATRFGGISDYVHFCEDEICVLVQVETRKGLDNLVDIASVDGVDGVFIGPADLSASLGYLGEPDHPDMQEIIKETIQTIRNLGKAPGVLAFNEQMAHRCIEQGALFTAVGMDLSLLKRGATELFKKYKNS